MSRPSRLALLPIVAMAACSYTIVGPPFHTAPIPTGTGIIYIYRPDSSKGQAWARPVFVDGVLVGDIFRAGYVPYHVAPGNHTIMISGSAVHQIQVSVPPNGEVYVLYDVGFMDTTLKTVTSERAHDDLQDCKLLPGGYDARDRI